MIGQRIGQAYEHLSIAFHSQGYFRKVIECEKHLKITMEIGDCAGEEKGY